MSGGETSAAWAISFADLMTILVVFFVLQISPQAVNSENQAKETEKLAQAISTLEGHLGDEDIADNVELELKGNRAKIVLPESLVFDSASARFSYAQKRILAGIVKQLKPLAASHYIKIEGHTDSSPINTAEYRSNWYLSSARALEVLQVFISQGFKQDKLSAQGFGEFSPLVAEQGKGGKELILAQEKNRRVSIVIYGSDVKHSLDMR